jgi:hypothetical protein
MRPLACDASHTPDTLLCPESRQQCQSLPSATFDQPALGRYLDWGALGEIAHLATEGHRRLFNPPIRAPRHNNAQDEDKANNDPKRQLAVKQVNAIQHDDGVPEIQTI